MEFQSIAGELSCQSELVYRQDEYSFDTVPSVESSYATILINDLGIELNEEGVAHSVGGLCAYTLWKNIALTAPEYRKSKVKVDVGEKLEAGVSYRLNKKTWPVFYDESSSWICLGDFSIVRHGVMFAPGAILILASGEPDALWLKYQPF